MLKTLVNGAIFNIANVVIQVVLGMLVFREMFIHFGEDDFGQWAFVFAILSHLMLFEFGLGSLIARLTPVLSDTKDNVDRLSSAILLIFGIGFIFLIAIAIVSAQLDSFTHSITFSGDIDLSLIVLLLACNFVLSFQSGALQAYLTGKFKVGRLNIVKVLINILRASGILYFLNSGYGVTAVAACYAASAILQTLLFLVFSIQVGLNKEFRFSACTAESFRYLARRGSRFMFMNINGYTRNNGSIISCGILIGATAAVPLRIAGRLIEIYSEVAISLIYMLTPYFSSLNKVDNESFLVRFKLSVYASSLVSILIFVNIYYVGIFFLETWLGDVPEGTYEILVILALGYCYENAQAPTSPLLISRDKSKAIMAINLTETTVFLLLIYPAIMSFGVIGAAYTVVVSLVIARVIMLPQYVCKELKVSVFTYYRYVLTPFTVILPIAVLLHYVSTQISLTLSISTVFVFVALEFVICSICALWIVNNVVRAKAQNT